LRITAWTALTRRVACAGLERILRRMRQFFRYHVPRPQKTDFRKNDPYIIYAIYFNRLHDGKLDTWKYGISAVGVSRPKSQLRKCRAHSRTDCTYQEMGRRTGYFAARELEYYYITQYVIHNGHCPLGQYYSCK